MEQPGLDKWTCAGNHAGDLDGTEDGAKVEAIMRLARLLVDENGLVVFYSIPPALAVAIVNAFDSGDPVTYARSRLPHGPAS